MKKTHIERLIELVHAIDGQAPANRRLEQFADDFVSYRRDQIEAAGFDPLSMTRAQKASVVLDAYAHHGKSVQEAMFMRRGVDDLKAEVVQS